MEAFLPTFYEVGGFMLRVSRSHSDFKNFLVENLKINYLLPGLTQPVLLYRQLIACVWNTDLSKVASIVGHRYSLKRGAPARDPVDLFRSSLLMELTQVQSVDDWVAQLKAFPIWAILSGFDPSDVPGVGTFYDFFKRLWLGAAAHLSLKVRKPRHKPRKGKKKGEKSPIRKPGVVSRLVKRFLKHPPSFHKQPHDLLQQIMKECFVLPSAQKGILGDISSLSIAGDGTSVRTGASQYGKSICNCRKNGIYKCNCARRFSDPDADWGWDSYREVYYFGRSLYAFTAADSPYDLPIYLHLYKASRHDSVAFVPSFLETVQLYPEFSFSECMLDSAHDAHPIYELLRHYNVGAIIDLNTRNSGKITSQGSISFTKDAIPVCPSGHIMAYDGYCKSRNRHKWRCPLTRKKWNVECTSRCSSSSYGRVFYTYEQDNLRYFTRIPRGTDLWKSRYKRRTTAERLNKRLKEDYLLERRGKIRSSRAWNLRVFFSAMCLHIDAWIKYESIDFRQQILQWELEVKKTAA